MGQFRNNGQFNQSIDPSLFIFNNDLIPTNDNAFDVGSQAFRVANYYGNSGRFDQVILSADPLASIGFTQLLGENIIISAGDALVLGAMTTAERNALTAPTNGMLIYNTTTNQTETYENGGWRQV